MPRGSCGVAGEQHVVVESRAVLGELGDPALDYP